MVLLDNDGFLTELSKLYAKTKISGSIWLTMKRYEHQMVSEGEGKGSSSVKKQKIDSLENEPRCLLRATDGKTKISTYLLSKDVVRFQLAIANILKTQMDSLKSVHYGQ